MSRTTMRLTVPILLPLSFCVLSVSATFCVHRYLLSLNRNLLISLNYRGWEESSDLILSVWDKNLLLHAVLLALVMLVFAVEMAVQSIGVQQYYGSAFFFMDFIGFLSVITDFTFVLDLQHEQSSTGDSTIMQVAKMVLNDGL